MAFWNREKIETTPSGITVRAAREDRPKFKRIYEADLNSGRRIKVEIYTSYGGSIFKNGELTQPGGRWVLFDPDRIADKILDQNLVPLVQERVDEIARLDKNFRHNNPGEFVDDTGTTWQRV